MPLIRIAFPAHSEAAFRAAVSDAVHDSLVETFRIPPDDRFQILTDHAAGTEIVRPASYLGIQYSDALLIVQITANEGRTVEQKKALYRQIADRLARLGHPIEDVVINLVEVKKENWSFGQGEAPYA